MKLQNLIFESICGSTAHVFSTMMGRDTPGGITSVEPGTADFNDGVVSFIGIAGAWAGTGSINCTPLAACRICSQMLMVEATAVDEEVLDAVAELTNIIIGGVKTDLETHLGPLGLSLPTVVFGRNFKTRSSGHREWVVVNFHWDGEPLTVKMCLEPSEPAGRLGGGQMCTVDL